MEVCFYCEIVLNRLRLIAFTLLELLKVTLGWVINTRKFA